MRACVGNDEDIIINFYNVTSFINFVEDFPEPLVYKYNIIHDDIEKQTQNHSNESKLK